MKKRLYYAWVNAALCVLVVFFCGTISQTYGVFLPAISEDLKISMSQISAAVTVLNAVMAVCGPLAASVVEKSNMRKTLPVVLACLAVILIMLAGCHHVLPIYILYALCGCCLYFGLFFLCPYIVNKWFRVRVAETIAFIITSMAVGGVAGNLVLSYLIDRYSWRIAYRTEACFFFLLALLIALLLRDRPEEMGLEPYGSGQEEEKTAQTDRVGGEGLTLRQVMGLPAFYFIILYVAAMQFCVGMQSQIPTLGISMGLAAVCGAAAASLNSLGGIFAKAFLSVLNVKMGVVKSVVFYNLAGILGICSVLYLKNKTGLYLFALLFGFAIGSTTVQLPLFSNRLFGASADYNKIHARIVMISGLLATPSALLAGAVYDATGSYCGMLCLMILLLAVAAVMARKVWKSA